MTDNMIIQAVRFRKEDVLCGVCNGKTTHFVTNGDVLSLIYHQKEKIKRLQSMNQAKQDLIHDLRTDLETAKAEAIKEVFDKVDSMCIDTFGNFNHKAFISIKKEMVGDDNVE